jgi:hypothetical protein
MVPGVRESRQPVGARLERPFCLELELQRELDRTRAADLVERVETCIIGAGQAAG